MITSAAKLSEPLGGLDQLELRRRGIEYAWSSSLTDSEARRAFELGAVLAQDPEAYRDDIEGLTELERSCLRREVERKWNQPKLMYMVIVICSICAAIQASTLWFCPEL